MCFPNYNVDPVGGLMSYGGNAKDAQRLVDVYASEEQQRTGAYEYNYQPGTPAAAFATRLTPDGPAKGAAMTGTNVATYVREKPGMSAFALEDGTVYHTYSAYARGLDGLWGAYQWLDRAPNGRNETAYWWRRHDEYDKP